MTPDPLLDLVFERTVDVSPDLVWMAWTHADHLKRWFAPLPWKVTACEIDLRPGGLFHTVMESPEGQQVPTHGCYLEVVPNHRLTWTTALEAGFRPTARNVGLGFPFTATLSFDTAGRGTRYTATLIHQNAADRAKHEAMGFADGWGKALTQLVAHVKTIPVL